MDPEYNEPETLGVDDPEFPWLAYEDDDYEQDCN